MHPCGHQTQASSGTHEVVWAGGLEDDPDPEPVLEFEGAVVVCDPLPPALEPEDPVFEACVALAENDVAVRVTPTAAQFA